MWTRSVPTGLINFLREELAIPNASIALALKQGKQDPSQLHMVLWQLGLVTLTQLEQVLDWLDAV